jgi:hypothetical protein
MIPLWIIAGLVCGSLAQQGGCADPGPDRQPEVWPEQMRLQALEPITVVAGTTVYGVGQGLVTDILGTTQLHLFGTFTGSSGTPTAVDTAFLVEVQSQDRLSFTLDAARFARICPGGDGEFVGTAQLEVASASTGRIYTAPPVAVGLKCSTALTPELISIDSDEAWFNAEIPITADNLLLDTSEGRSVVAISGCFRPRGVGEPCSENGQPVAETRLPITVTDENWRRDGMFLVSTDLVGLTPGTLEADIRIINEHASGPETSSVTYAWRLKINPSKLEAVDSTGSSLGGYVDFLGKGFVGSEPDELTEIHLLGEFVPDSGGDRRDLDLILIPAFDSGSRVRYVLNEDDTLADFVDLRTEAGTVTGTFEPTLVKGETVVVGDAITGNFRIEHIKQVVYVNFLPGYTDALDMLGLRAADSLLRARILEKARWIYRGVNVEFRTEIPEDYELYAQVDITGQDPNGLGLMGYDNTPGKDVGNLRLWDRVGGVNAATQQDGYPGYGGVFVDSFFAFSTHPPLDIDPHPAADALFDMIFDPVRPDLGQPVRPEELENLPQAGSALCPATPGDRPLEIACAIYVAGNMLGSTMAHEFGHSLGLADPGGDNFHNTGEQPNRLMDAGGKRPFHERTDLLDGGPEVFCRENFKYLQQILPTADETDPVPNRPNCY